MRYELRLAATASGVGYFAACPLDDVSLDENLAYLRSCPLDDFMHRHLLDRVGRVDAETARRILDMARDRDSVMMTLLYEACLSFRHLAPLRELFDAEHVKVYLAHTPLTDIKSAGLDDQQVHADWMSLFEQNISELRPLPPPEACAMPSLYSREDLSAVLQGSVHVHEVCEKLNGGGLKDRVDLPSARATAKRALDTLGAIGVIAEDEMIHHSSLSPHGFLRRWRLEVSVKNGRHDYTLTGIQTSYGKGLSADGARASYAMEMVERCSSFASVGPDRLFGFREAHPLIRSSYRELRDSGKHVLDPNALRLEAPYANEPLHWLWAEELAEKGLRPILIPVQTVFLFCNLDEVNLFSGLGSTGLASGNTPEQAQVSALLEVIERDCEGTMPYHPSLCFQLVADDPEVASLLADYEAKGIHIQFQDLTNELGVPCYKCMVLGPRGGVVKGTGAHLDGRKALLSALTETPYPYPEGPPSAPGLEGLATVRFENLPGYGTGDPAHDLDILETLFASNGYRPIYVDLTREDVGIPVVKAIVPGMELSADFDRFSRVSPRLFVNYLRAVGSL